LERKVQAAFAFSFSARRDVHDLKLADRQLMVPDHSELIEVRERMVMRRSVLLVLLVSASIIVAQDNNLPKGATLDNSKPSKGQITVEGCVGRSNGDYTLVKPDPAMTYELHAAGKMKLSRYLGQQVQVTGTTSPSLWTSSDSLEGRAPSSVTLTVTIIRTVAKECTE
jgi:hypothetical protein